MFINEIKFVSFARFKMAKLSLLFISLVFCIGSAQAESIKDVMKNEMNPAFKVLVAGVRKNEINQNMKVAGAKLLEALTKIQNQVPAFIPKNGQVVKPTDDDIKIYKQYMSDMIILAQQLVESMNAGQFDGEKGVKSVVTLMNDLRSNAHDQFKGQ
jgi:hypothetical protein